MNIALIGGASKMPKLTPVCEYRKDGSKNVKAYRVSLQKTECEKFDLQNKEFDVEYLKDKIVLKVKN